MMVLDSLVVLFFLLYQCFFYTLLQSLDPMEQDCFLIYKKEKHYRARYHRKVKIKNLRSKLRVKKKIWILNILLIYFFEKLIKNTIREKSIAKKIEYPKYHVQRTKSPATTQKTCWWIDKCINSSQVVKLKWKSECRIHMDFVCT